MQFGKLPSACLHQPFFYNFLTKCQHGNHLKFGEALYFYIHPSSGPKCTFQSYLYTFSSKFDDFIRIFNKNGKILVKKDYIFFRNGAIWPHGAGKKMGCWTEDALYLLSFSNPRPPSSPKLFLRLPSKATSLRRLYGGERREDGL